MKSILIVPIAFALMLFACTSQQQLPGPGSSQAELDMVKVINLSNKHLDSIPDIVFSCKNLEKLILFNNHISSISPEINKLTLLKRLDLGRNDLVELPTEIGDLENLVDLSVQFNSLTKIPPSIFQLESIEDINLKRNRLEHLPDMRSMVKLERLELDNNWLEVIPPSIGYLSNLNYLSLSSNRLDSIPPEMGNLSRLNYLNLFNAGSVLNIPDALCNLTMLDELYINARGYVPPCLRSRQIRANKIPR